MRRFEDADDEFDSIDDDVDGYLREVVPLRRAEIAVALGKADDAVDILDDLADEEALNAPEEVLLRLAQALEAAGEREKAVKTYQRVYYEFPLSTQSAEAQGGIERLQTTALIPAERFRLELDRAEQLFAARRWAQARPAFLALAKAATADDAELAAIRIAECDYHLDRYRAREALRPYLHGGAREPEARFYYLSATRALGERATYVTLARDLITDYPASKWAEETLNNLASHYVTNDDDETADGVFRSCCSDFRKAATPIARHGRSAGGRTSTTGLVIRPRPSKSLRRHFLARTSVPRGCLGRPLARSARSAPDRQLAVPRRRS